MNNQKNEPLSHQSLGSDNHSGVHPKIMQALMAANRGHAPSYGQDEWTAAAVQIFKREFGAQAEVAFVFNGSGANVTALKLACRSHESIACSEIAHLHRDECGAPELLIGSKLSLIPSQDGLFGGEAILDCLRRRGDQHVSQVRVVSLTQPTEHGVVFTPEHLRQICELAHTNDLYVHMDGARLTLAAAALNCSLAEITKDVGIDLLSFGGTKNGLLLGEAVVVLNPKLGASLRYVRKQCLQLPSKTRFIAAQFMAFFEDELWRKIALHEINLAKRLEARVRQIPEIQVLYPVQTNAVFARFPKAWTKALKESAFFYVWDEKVWTARWMISHDTTESSVDAFCDQLESLSLNY